MIGQQGPTIDGRPALHGQGSQAPDKLVTVCVIGHNRPALDAAQHDVVEGAGLVAPVVASSRAWRGIAALLWVVTTWKLSKGFSVIQKFKNVPYSTPAVFGPGWSSSKTGRTKRPTTLREGGKNEGRIKDTVGELLGATIGTRFEYEWRCQCLQVCRSAREAIRFAVLVSQE